MIVLPAGPKKYLLIDEVAVERNASRRTEGQPIAMVFVEAAGDEAPVLCRARTVAFKGPVELEYRQDGYVIGDRHRKVRAAYVTTAEVVLDGVPEAITGAPPVLSVFDDIRDAIPAKPKAPRPAALKTTTPKES